MKQIDGILANLTLRGEIGGDVNRRIGDADQPVMFRNVDQKDVTAAPTGHAQAVVAVQNGAHEHIGVDIALHDKIGLAAAHHPDRNG